MLFGDMGGNFYALDSTTGQKLWGRDLGGAIAGGVITYMANGAQKVAVAAGFTSGIWPEPGVATCVLLGMLHGVARHVVLVVLDSGQQ